MEAQDSDASETKDSGSPPSTRADGKQVPAERIPAEQVSEDWLSGEWFSGWGDQFPNRRRKIATALLMVVIVGLGTGGYYWYQDAQEESHQKQLRETVQKFSDPIFWPINKINTLDSKFQLVTKWVPTGEQNENLNYRKGEIKYKLRVEGYPEAIKNAWSSEFNSSYFVTIHLMDEDDFRVASLKITLDKMIRTLNPRGEGIGFSVQGSETMSLRTYRRVDDWKITWNL